MSTVLAVRISENEKTAIGRAVAISGRSQSSLAAAVIWRDMWELAWLDEKVANARASRDLSETEVNAMFSVLERECKFSGLRPRAKICKRFALGWMNAIKQRQAV